MKIIIMAIVLAIGGCVLAPQRAEPDRVPTESDRGLEYCRAEPDGARVCVICRTYPIFRLDGTISNFQEICR